jgi:hypothetical protein
LPGFATKSTSLSAEKPSKLRLIFEATSSPAVCLISVTWVGAAGMSF